MIESMNVPVLMLVELLTRLFTEEVSTRGK